MPETMLVSKGYAELATHLIGCVTVEIWPHLSPAAAFRRVGPPLCLGNTVEVALMVVIQVI